MSKLAQQVQNMVDSMATDDTTTSVTENTEGETGMAKAKTSGKRARKAAEPKVKTAKATRAPRAKRTNGRITADAVFTFVKQVDQPKRAQAILNAIEKIGSGTAAQVAARVTKTDYSGKQDLEYLSGFFLRKFVALGAVAVEQPAAKA